MDSPGVGGPKCDTGPSPIGGASTSHHTPPRVRAQKMMVADDPEAFINTFECTMVADGWPSSQWLTILIPCLIGPAQQAVDTLPLQDLPDYKKVKVYVLQTLNLNPEAYHCRLQEIECGLDYHPQLMGQKIKSTCLKWLHPTEHTAEEGAKMVCVKHDVDLLPKVVGHLPPAPDIGGCYPPYGGLHFC